MNIVIPMAGRGTRVASFSNRPKPLIELHKKTMIERVMDNLYLPESKIILVALQEHVEAYPEDFKRVVASPKTEVITIPEVSMGAACTVLAAHRLFNNESPLILACSDQIVDVKISDFVEDCLSRQLDGSILSFKSNEPHWTYSKVDNNGIIETVKEKVPISEHAAAGIYLFSKGKDFINGALDMIVAKELVQNEFFIAPAYNYLIARGKKFGIYNFPKESMFCLGKMDELTAYEKYLEQNLEQNN